MKLSIIIPAHNEEKRLPPVLEAYAEYFSSRMGDEVELLVVVNGSDDDTEEVANKVGEKYPQIRVIVDSRKIGKGGAIILGAKEAVGDRIGYVDADGATTAEEFYRLYGEAKSVDGVIASRWMKGSEVTMPQKRLRLLSSRVFNLLIRGLLGLKFKDTQCGAKIFTAEAWRKILPDVGITRFAFDVDVLFQLKRHGYKVLELPTVWCDVAGSKVNVLGSSFDMFCALVRMRLLHSPFRFIVTLYERFLSKPVEWLRHDDLFCHTTIIFSASIVMHICNIAYQMVVSRALAKSEYALLMSLLAVLAIIMRPLGTVSTAINHYTSVLDKEGRLGLVRRLIAKWLVLMGGVSLLLAVVCALFANQIAAFLHLNRVAPVYVTAAALPVIFVSPVLGGVIQGMQRFGASSLSAIAGSVGRVAIASVLVLLLFPACGWALAGHVGGMYISSIITFLVLLNLLRRISPNTSALPSLRMYLFQCFFIQVSAAVLMMGDVVMVKHYLPGETDFAYAATLGRMVAYMSVAVAAAMFPKVSSAGAFTTKHRSVYLRSLLYTACLVSVSILVCSFFPELLHRILFRINNPSDSLLSLTRGMAVVMAIATLLNINVLLLLAQRRFKLAAITVLSALLYLGGVFLFHESAYQVVVVAGIANLISLVVTSLGILRVNTVEHELAGGES